MRRTRLPLLHSRLGPGGMLVLSPYNAFVWKHHFLAATCLVYYEWLVTLDLEVERIWSVPFNLFTLLWIFVRYLPLLSMFIITCSMFQNWPAAVCSRFAIIPTIVLLAGLTTSHMVFLLRTYALYGRDRRVLYFLGIFMVTEFGAVVWGAATEQAVVTTYEGGCFPHSPRRAQGIVMWTAPFLFDASVFALTVAKSIIYFRNHAIKLVALILRDGLIYFGFIMICYLANTLLYIIGPSEIHDINAPMSGIITMIVTARLILNLRGVTFTKPPSPSSARFTLTGLESVIAAFDGPLSTDERTREANQRTRDATARSILQRLDHAEYELASTQSPSAFESSYRPFFGEYDQQPAKPLEPSVDYA